MEKIKIRKLINLHDDDENFIYQIWNNITTYIDNEGYLADDSIWTQFTSYYVGHSGNKYLGGEGYTQLDDVSLVDDEENDVSVVLSSGDDTGVIYGWDVFSTNLASSLAYHYFHKWSSIANTLKNNYKADINDDETYNETITNNLTDTKDYGKTNETKRATNISSSDSVTNTDQTMAYNGTSFQDVNKTTSTSDSTTTAEADANVTNSADSGTDTTKHTGTRSRSYTRTGGSDNWRRGREYLNLLATDLFETMARDIDSAVTLPYYSLD